VGDEIVTSVTRKEVAAMLGPLDDVVVAKIIATGATLEELAEAHAWTSNDEALMNIGKPLAGGRVAHLVEIIAAVKEEEEEEEAARQG
jgi:hypothetical protein